MADRELAQADIAAPSTPLTSPELDSLAHFVHRDPTHVAVLRQRRRSFPRMAEAHQTLWWVPAGSHPTVAATFRGVALQWEQVAIQAVDPVELGRWWAEGLGWVVVDDGPDVVEIRPAPDRVPGIIFLPVPEPKVGQNRLHLDFRPDDHAAEVARFLALGATRASVGQGADTPWVVLADPEGNEFCILGERHA